MTLPSTLRRKKVLPVQAEREEVLETPVLSTVPKKDGQEFPSTLRRKEKPVVQAEEAPNFETDEDLEREIERGQAVTTSRMLERLIGFPGDVVSLLPEKLQQAFGLDLLPTSAKLREKSEQFSRGYTKPRTEFEEKAGDFAGEVASFATGKPGANVLGTIGRSIGIPLAGLLSKEGVKELGGGNKLQEYTKLGTMLLLDLWGLRKGTGRGGAYKFGQERLKDAEKSIPKNAMADVKVFDNKLTKLDASLRGGITGPHTSEALRAIDEIKGHIKNGQMPASKFPQLRKDINKLIENMKGFSLGGPPRNIKRASVSNLNDVKSSLIQAGNRWGRGNNPEFFNAWREGNEALSVYFKSKDIANFLGKHAKIKDPTIRMALGIHSASNPIQAASLFAAKKGLEHATKIPTGFIYRMFNSKILRNLYTSILKEAAKGNAQNVASLSKKLEEYADKEGLTKKD